MVALAALFPLVVAIASAFFLAVLFPESMGIHSQAADNSPEPGNEITRDG